MSETYSALRDYRRRIAAMLDDPECVGDILSLGLALLDFAVLRTSTNKDFDAYAARAWGANPGSTWRVRHVLRQDIRRYDAIKDAEANSPARLCGAPMIRRSGPCGQSASIRGMLTDADTGREQWIAACKRHGDWFTDRTRANRTLVEQTEPITRPVANAGGVLARHIPEIDWPAVWVGIDPKWTAPPEGSPEEVPLKPRLSLVLGGAS